MATDVKREGRNKGGVPRQPKFRARETKRPPKGRARYGDPILDNPRPPLGAPLGDFPDAQEMARRADQDWAEDDQGIEALARHYGIPKAPPVNSSADIQMQKHWIALSPPAESLEEWRALAWHYRQVLVSLARETVTGFRRKQSQPVRWSGAHMEYLDATIGEVRRLQKCSEIAALQFLARDNPWDPGTPFLPADVDPQSMQKVLQRWRRLRK